MKDSYKFWILMISGFFTLIMASTSPTIDGADSLIFMISVPFFVVLGIIFAFIYRYISRKISDSDIKGIAFSLLLFFMIAFNFLAFPM